MTAKSPDIQPDIELAEQLAEAARAIATEHFRNTSLDIDNKRHEDGAFDPVTVADRDIESAIRAILDRERPDDGVMGEEHANKSGTSGRHWVIDPIDGTRSFMCGLPTWGVLIALNDGNRPVLGMMDQPFTRERFIGVTETGDIRGTALWPDGEAPLKSRRCDSLSGAVMCTTAPDAFASADDSARFSRLSRQVKMTRYGTDCYGYAMIARGQIDLVVESGLQAYDIQAMIPIVEAAGGVVTDWNGGDCQHGGRVIAAGDERLHALAIDVLSA